MDNFTLNNNFYNIVLFCGIPGSGKSSIIKLLSNYVNKKNNFEINKDILIIHSYDEFYYEFYGNYNFDKFKESRCKFTSYIKNIIDDKINEDFNNSTRTNNNNYIIIEDNFPLRSSRKVFYNLVENYINKSIITNCTNIFSYIEVHINNSLTKCLSNNISRKTSLNINNDTIVSMNICYELKSVNNIVNYLILNEEDIDILINNNINCGLKVLETTFCNIKKILYENNLRMKENIIKDINLNKSNYKQDNKKDISSEFLEKLDIAIRKKISEIAKNKNLNNKEIIKKLSSLKSIYLKNIKRNWFKYNSKDNDLNTDIHKDFIYNAINNTSINFIEKLELVATNFILINTKNSKN